ncbi:hypothetical protein Q8G48_28345, partial [Klebsiella pneumoniae]|uniref:hypothetical protein n=1 Tax=Klebsiella pneumoniae TaxID=573 RepID=UPI0030141D0E
CCHLVSTEMFRHGGFITNLTVEVSILTLTEGKSLCFLHKFQTMNLKNLIFTHKKYISSAFTDQVTGLFYISLLFISVINSDATCWQRQS